ncbi:transposable element Tcb2 transposase [Trichonephila clavipes]|nr:transposable element Tcb2 transposase [Trichonephila clavipes]
MEAGLSASREYHRIVKNARVQPTASSAVIQAQVAPSLGAPVSSRTIRGTWLEDIWDLSTHYVCAAFDAPHRRLHLEWCRVRGNWTLAEWNQVVFSDESRFNLSSDDHHVRVWRPRSNRLNHAFALQ